MLNILPKLELKFEKKITLTIENLNRKYSNLGFYYIFGLIKGLKDLAGPSNLSPEIGATETLKKSPETAETMASLQTRDDKLPYKLQVKAWSLVKFFCWIPVKPQHKHR